jgi:hypothetical protein
MTTGCFGAGEQVVDVGDAAGHHRSRARIRDVDAALGVQDEIIRRQERLAADAFGDGRDRAVAAALADSFAVAFRREQIPVVRQREAVGAVGLLANSDFAGCRSYREA